MSEISLQSFPLLRLNTGLNKASSPVNIEPTDAADLSNIDLELNGGISRRGAIDFIGEKDSGGFYLQGTVDYLLDEKFLKASPSLYVFTTVLSDNLYHKFLCIHVNDKFLFFKFNDLLSLRNLDTPYQELTIHTDFYSSDAKFFHTTFKIDRGKLFILNPGITPGYFFVDGEDKFVFTPITVFARDLDEGVTSFVNDGNVSYYCLISHTSSADTRPGVGANWKTYWYRFGPFADNPDPSGTNKVPNWANSRAYTTNIKPVNDKFSTMEFSTGRLWFGGAPSRPNTIFFSQSIREERNYGWCFSKADPLQEYDPNPVDSDGGTLEINGMDRILSLRAFKEGVLVFATNGIWFIRGTGISGAFSATDFSVTKVSSTSAIGVHAIVPVENNIVFFGYGGVFMMKEDSLTTELEPSSISVKIDPFYTDISIENRSSGKAIYNPATKKIYFLTNFRDYRWTRDWNPNGVAGTFRDMLIFDFTLQAWTTYSLTEDREGVKVNIADMISVPASDAVDNFITTFDGHFVVDNEVNNNFVVGLNAPSGERGFVNICLVSKKNLNKWDISLSLLDRPVDKDFNSNIDDAEDYSSYFLTAHINFQNIMNKKQTPTLYVVFDRVEVGTLNPLGEDINSGGCLMSSSFDWASDKRSFKWGPVREIYRPTKWNVSKYDGRRPDFQTVTVKEKIRGRGNSVQFLFENNGNKMFRIYGIQINVTASGRV